MAGGAFHKTLAYLRRVAGTGEPAALSDSELLERFVRSRDEAAFEVLLWRHGPVVLGVCRRVLRHDQDAEDAFQGTFLTLARKAASVARAQSLASWLYKVAYRIALASRARAARLATEPVEDPLAPPPPDDLLWRDLRPVLDEEVSRLPEKYRAPVLLCDLQGLTHEEAARQLGCPAGTLSVRLMRARERLRLVLTRRGLAPCAVLLATGLAERASAALGTAQVASTVKAALAFAADAGRSVGSSPAAILARGALRTMFLIRLRNLTLAVAACLLAALAGVLTFHSLQAAPPPPAPERQGQRPQPIGKRAEPVKATPADVAAAVEGNTAFALDLYERLRTKEGNLFVSPYSLSTALAMTYSGARGETAAQMSKTLHFTLGQDRLHPALAELTGRLKGDKKRGFELRIANALWGQRGYEFLPEFLELNRKSYDAGLREVDFMRATEEARKTINAWAEKETEGKIKDLLRPANVDPSTRLVLTNAVYFKSAWQFPFEKKWTRMLPFQVTAERTVNVPMMSQTGQFRFFQDDKLKVVELPYKGKEVSLIALLPVKADGLGDLERQLTPTNLKQWLGRLKPALVMVSLPRFEVASSFSLKQVLAEMGMPLAFSPRLADFSGMDGKKVLFIQAAIHKTFVKVDEVGTEAAGATAIAAGFGGVPPMFMADHPFLFLIRDNRSGSVLFLGRVVEPR
jgi:serpin B